MSPLKLTRPQRLAVTAANRYCRGKPSLTRAEQMTWRQACALAPWPRPGLCAEDEREYRENFANELVNSQQAQPRRKSTTASGVCRKPARKVRWTAEEYARQDELAAVARLPWSTWLLGRTR